MAIVDYWNRLSRMSGRHLRPALEKCDPNLLNSPMRRSYLGLVCNDEIRTLLFGPSSE